MEAIEYQKLGDFGVWEHPTGGPWCTEIPGDWQHVEGHVVKVELRGKLYVVLVTRAEYEEGVTTLYFRD